MTNIALKRKRNGRSLDGGIAIGKVAKWRSFFSELFQTTHNQCKNTENFMEQIGLSVQCQPSAFLTVQATYWPSLNMSGRGCQPEQIWTCPSGPVTGPCLVGRGPVQGGVGVLYKGKARSSMVGTPRGASLWTDRHTWLKTLPSPLRWRAVNVSSWSTRVTDYQSVISTSYLNYSVMLSSLPSVKCHENCLSPKNFYIYRHIEPHIERQ